MTDSTSTERTTSSAEKNAGRGMLKARTFDHITLVVADLEASRAFYVDLIGMEQVPRPDFGFPGMWFQLGTAQIHLNIASDAAGRAGQGDMGAGSPPQGVHFAFSVDDCDIAVGQFTEQGIAIEAGPRSRPDGARQAYVRDPDGYLVEITSPAQAPATQA
ncbi:MAG: catechol 2,3-dioxygenase-like lactoylglutathione lyase family enzyme [Verrucomicrobiales bacterium]|jgi:catechol 2,3-dioxygenase-like lactoylglutathione lyase family enzyme